MAAIVLNDTRPDVVFGCADAVGKTDSGVRGPRSERATATQPTSGPTLYPRIGFGSVGFDGSF